jgi:hypothetical protein
MEPGEPEIPYIPTTIADSYDKWRRRREEKEEEKGFTAEYFNSLKFGDHIYPHRFNNTQHCRTAKRFYEWFEQHSPPHADDGRLIVRMQRGGRWKTYAPHLVYNTIPTSLRAGSLFRLFKETGGLDYEHDFEKSDAETMFNDSTFHIVGIIQLKRTTTIHRGNARRSPERRRNLRWFTRGSS